MATIKVEAWAVEAALGAQAWITTHSASAKGLPGVNGKPATKGVDTFFSGLQAALRTAYPDAVAAADKWARKQEITTKAGEPIAGVTALLTYLDRQGVIVLRGVKIGTNYKRYAYLPEDAPAASAGGNAKVEDIAAMRKAVTERLATKEARDLAYAKGQQQAQGKAPHA